MRLLHSTIQPISKCIISLSSENLPKLIVKKFYNHPPLKRSLTTGFICSAKEFNWGSKKQHRKIKLNFPLDMSDPKIEEALAPLRANVKEQGDLVRKLKADGAPELDVKKAVAELKLRKKILEDKEMSFSSDAHTFDRARLEDLLKRRFFYDQSFAIYGGIAGQYDFGPVGCRFKRNLLSAWCNFFIDEEEMLEVECSILTPEPILKASGHVDRFADLMVKDLKSGECYRLDHLIKAHLEKLSADKKTDEATKNECADIIIKLDGMNKSEMAAVIEKFNIKSPSNGNDLSEPLEFNLMFGIQIGPSGLVKGFLRPETAQGIFVNFKRLLEFNQDKLPFAAAQIGSAFRNEISPRSGLIRVREFTMAEIEHFCDPNDKSHSKFIDIKDTKILLYSACNQMDGKSAELRTIGDAVAEGLVANETLGYFMARIQMFMILVGVDPAKLRFRQHMSNEMAHYACDCWDAECLTSYGWIECVGCADRSAYDLTQHTKKTGVRLAAEKKLAVPKTVDVVEAQPNRGLIGTSFRKDAKKVLDALAGLDKAALDDLEAKLATSGDYNLGIEGGNVVTITKDMVSLKRYTQNLHVEEIIPSVIEPSFGIGRIMYAIFEHNFKKREEDEMRTFLSLPAIVAPYKCSVLPLSGKSEFTPFVKDISSRLRKLKILFKVDDSSGTIGRRYARTDEIAIPFAITIDFDTLKEPHTVTLRERDSMKQIRVPVDKVTGLVRDLSNDTLSWNEVVAKYPAFQQQEAGNNK